MKKFSETYINDFQDLKKFKVGLEFEFYTKQFSYYKLLEMLNLELDPVLVHGFRKYHSNFTPDENNFKLEPDLSGGSNMIELITGPLSFYDARYYLLKILNFIQEYGYTTKNSSVHINVSFNAEETQLKLNQMNILKHILNMDEEEIYSKFPSRENNIYAKSVKHLIPFKDYNFANISIGTVKNMIKVPDDKYYGVNYSHLTGRDEERRLEFRYIGGEDYEYQSGDILDLMAAFCLSTLEATREGLTPEDSKLLSEFLNDKISNFKNFLKYDSFLIEYPQIHLQVNQQSHYDIVNSYYPRMYQKIYQLLEGTQDLDEAIINYYVESNRFEIIQAEFASVLQLHNFDFIDCQITDGMFDKCNFVNSQLDNLELTKSKLDNSEATSSRLTNTHVDSGKLVDCYFINGYLNGHMEAGTFRSGKIGPYGSLSPSTVIVDQQQSFFGSTDDGDKSKKGFSGKEKK